MHKVYLVRSDWNITFVLWQYKLLKVWECTGRSYLTGASQITRLKSGIDFFGLCIHWTKLLPYVAVDLR